VQERADWIDRGFTIPVVWGDVGSFAQITQKAASGEKYADTELEQAVLQMFISSRPTTTVFFVPKDTPGVLLKILKEAFDKALKDPEFPAHFTKLTNESADPMTSEEIEKTLQKLQVTVTSLWSTDRSSVGAPLPPTR